MQQSASSSREGDVKPVWLIRKMQGSTLKHVPYSFVIPRGTKDFHILPGEPVGEATAIEILAWAT